MASGPSGLLRHVYESSGLPHDRGHIEAFEHRPRYTCAAADIKWLAPAGVEIGGRWRVRLNATGPLGGGVDDQPLAAAVYTEAQYSDVRC